MDEGRIEKRIAELKAQREDFVKQANQQIAALKAAPAPRTDEVVEATSVEEPWLVRVARRLTGSVR